VSFLVVPSSRLAALSAERRLAFNASWGDAAEETPMLPAGHSGAPGLNAATLYTVIRAACTSRCIFAMIFAGEMLAILFLDANKKKRGQY
jgi:hypothetical protein